MWMPPGWQQTAAAAVTVDLGTATTFNVIDEGGVFRGGAIAVGMATGLKALAAKTAQLPELRLDTVDSAIGKNTEACMESGAVIGAAAMIDGLVARIEQELGKPVTLVLTGGMARYAEPFCTHPHIYDPQLLAKGLMLLYEWNVERPAPRKFAAPAGPAAHRSFMEIVGWHAERLLPDHDMVTKEARDNRCKYGTVSLSWETMKTR